MKQALKYTHYLRRFFPEKLLLLACCLLHGELNAQTVQGSGGSYMGVSDTAVLVAGATYANNLRIQVNGGASALPKWKLTVQPLTAYFTAQQSSGADIQKYGYGPNWPIQYFSVRLNTGGSQNSWSNANSTSAIGAVSSPLALSASEITLVERSNYPMVPNDYFALSYDLIQSGSRQLLALHRDNYVLVLRFRLYNQAGNLVSQADYSHQIGLWPGWMHLPQSTGPQISNGILLQHGGSNVTLDFSSGNAYATGVESVLNNSLQVSSADGKYQVTVQTISAYFNRSGAPSQIPVSRIRLTATAASSSVSSSYQPVSLGTTAQTLITNNGSSGIVNNYNLTYTTKHNANQNAFMNAAAGSYNTQITFIMTPL